MRVVNFLLLTVVLWLTFDHLFQITEKSGLTFCIIASAHAIVWRLIAKFIRSLFMGASVLTWFLRHLRLLSAFLKKFLLLRQVVIRWLRVSVVRASLEPSRLRFGVLLFVCFATLLFLFGHIRSFQ